MSPEYRKDGQVQSREVLRVSPDDCEAPPGNRAVSLAEVEKTLAPNMRANGQQVPGIITDNPTPGSKKYLILAGVRRCLAAKLLDVPFEAIYIPGPVKSTEVIRVRLCENVIRKGMTPLEIASDLAEYIRLTGCTQEEAAEAFGFSPAKVCKLLGTDKRACPEVKAAMDSGQIKQDVGRVIASLPTAEMQQELLAKTVAGGLKRDVVEKIAKRMRGAAPKRVKARRIEGGGVSITVPGDWPLERIREAMMGRVKELSRAIRLKLTPDTLG